MAVMFFMLNVMFTQRVRVMDEKLAALEKFQKKFLVRAPVRARAVDRAEPVRAGLGRVRSVGRGQARERGWRARTDGKAPNGRRRRRAFPRPDVEAKVVVVEPTGAETELLVRVGDQTMTLVTHGRPQVGPDDRVHLGIATDKIHLFDGQSGQRLS